MKDLPLWPQLKVSLKKNNKINTDVVNSGIVSARGVRQCPRLGYKCCGFPSLAGPSCPVVCLPGCLSARSQRGRRCPDAAFPHSGAGLSRRGRSGARAHRVQVAQAGLPQARFGAAGGQTG